MKRRIGVASVLQETNTFSPRRCEFADFQAQGLLEGRDVWALVGTNTEVGGALAALRTAGAEVAPVFRAWAMPSGPLTAAAFDELVDRLRRQLRAAAPLDGLVLSLHGAMVADGTPAADLELLRAARDEVGNAPIVVCLDLHANVTRALVAESNALIGYHTYPHVDQALTGERAANLVMDLLAGAHFVTGLAKRPLLIAPEAQQEEGAFGRLQREARAAIKTPIVDISLFPVQPWLDVPELGFGVTVTSPPGKGAEQLAERLAEQAWRERRLLRVQLTPPLQALEVVRQARRRPMLLSESADSPTAGAAGDSPALLSALLENGRDLNAITTVLDEGAVAVCFSAGKNASISLEVGSSIEQRFHQPVPLNGLVKRLGVGRFRLKGPVFTGMEVTMGRFAVVKAGRLSVLLTERPAYTFDPETFRVAGLQPERFDVIVVRSANLFRAGWGELAHGALILDIPGASTPRLETLSFARAPRPLYPLDDCA